MEGGPATEMEGELGFLGHPSRSWRYVDDTKVRDFSSTILVCVKNHFESNCSDLYYCTYSPRKSKPKRITPFIFLSPRSGRNHGGPQVTGAARHPVQAEGTKRSWNVELVLLAKESVPRRSRGERPADCGCRGESLARPFSQRRRAPASFDGAGGWRRSRH